MCVYTYIYILYMYIYIYIHISSTYVHIHDKYMIYIYVPFVHCPSVFQVPCRVARCTRRGFAVTFADTAGARRYEASAAEAALDAELLQQVAPLPDARRCDGWIIGISIYIYICMYVCMYVCFLFRTAVRVCTWSLARCARH